MIDIRGVAKGLLPLAFFWVASCALKKDIASSEPEPRGNDAIAKALEEKPTEKAPGISEQSYPTITSNGRSAQDIENLTIGDVIRIEEPNTQNLYDDSRYDFPITMNAKVEGWMDYFTGRGRHHFERYLGRSSRYMPVMRKIFKKAGLPEDLIYLALIESGFNLRAHSRARAVGPWQFIKGTGRRYGLTVDAWIDDRRDPIHSTEAAAAYLKDLYLMFESWYLAAAAYNAGEHKILRAVEEVKTNNFWRICQTNHIRRETKDYIPKLIAAAILAKNPKRYGFDDIAYLEPLEFESVTIHFPIRLREVASLIDVDEEDLQELNPTLRRAMVPPGLGPFELRVPVGAGTVVNRALTAKRPELVTTELPKQYTVRAGETLTLLSQRFGVRKNELAKVNNLSPKEKITPGISLIIPTSSKRTLPPPVETTTRLLTSPIDEKEGGFQIHVVKWGESLWSISEKYDVRVQDIFRWNQLRNSRIRPGRRLKIRVG